MRYCGILALVAIICSVEVALSEGFFAAFSSTALPTSRRQQRQQPLERSPQSPFLSNHHQSKVKNIASLQQQVFTVPQGGAKKSSSALFLSKDGEAVTCPFTKTMAVFGSLWGLIWSHLHSFKGSKEGHSHRHGTFCGRKPYVYSVSVEVGKTVFHLGNLCALQASSHNSFCSSQSPQHVCLELSLFCVC